MRSNVALGCFFEDREAEHARHGRVGRDREEEAHADGERGEADDERRAPREIARQRAPRRVTSHPADAERGRGDAEDRAARRVARREPDGADRNPPDARRRAAHVVERGSGEAEERHRERGHRDGVAEHRARLHEDERHRDERDDGVEADAPVHEALEERVRDRRPRERPHGEREPAHPVVQPEQPKADGHRRERELAHLEVGERGQRRRRVRQIEPGRAEHLDGDAPREVGRVELVRIPDAAVRERAEEDERGDGGRGEARPGAREVARRTRRRHLCAAAPAERRWFGLRDRAFARVARVVRGFARGHIEAGVYPECTATQSEGAGVKAASAVVGAAWASSSLEARRRARLQRATRGMGPSLDGAALTRIATAPLARAPIARRASRRRRARRRRSASTRSRFRRSRSRSRRRRRPRGRAGAGASRSSAGQASAVHAARRGARDAARRRVAQRR